MNEAGYTRGDLRNLLDLQRLDSDIARQRAVIDQALNDPKVLALRERVGAAARAAQEAKDRAARLRRTAAWEEKEADSIRAEVSGMERKMYGGLVSSPKELDQMQKKVEQLRVDLGAHEEAGLAALVELEEAGPAVETAQKALDEVGRLLARAEESQKTAVAGAEEIIRGLEPKRAEMAARLPGALLQRYERIRDRRGGVGAAALTPDGRCGACLVKVPILLAQVVRDGGVEICESCGRLIVRGEPPAPGQAPGDGSEAGGRA